MTGYSIFCTVLASLTLCALPWLWRVLRIDGLDRPESSSSPSVTGGSRPSVIYLQHHGTIFPVEDIWEAIQVTRCLAEIDDLPEYQEAM